MLQHKRMKLLRTAMIAVLCGAACVQSAASGEESADDSTLGDNGAASEIAGEVPEEETDICGLLPASGPCSAACDPMALVEHVPPGVCAAFRCTLTDGREIAVSACHR